jgi:hypothetical protein
MTGNSCHPERSEGSLEIKGFLVASLLGMTGNTVIPSAARDLSKSKDSSSLRSSE